MVDWHTGLHRGLRPDRLFTDSKQKYRATQDLELRKGGGVWRFTNVGNRAHCRRAECHAAMAATTPSASARLAVAGSPSVWLIQGQRLFLFYDNTRRQKFANDPSRVTASTDRKWQDVQRTLTPVIFLC